MANIKKVVRKSLEGTLADAEQTVQQTRQALTVLQDIDTRTATYAITLRSMWADHGEKDVSNTYKGPLSKAITEAEREFMELNRRQDVQAHYDVAICVDSTTVRLPETTYKAFTYRARKEATENATTRI
jgi:hypothetical protein